MYCYRNNNYDTQKFLHLCYLRLIRATLNSPSITLLTRYLIKVCMPIDTKLGIMFLRRAINCEMMITAANYLISKIFARDQWALIRSARNNVEEVRCRGMNRNRQREMHAKRFSVSQMKPRHVLARNHRRNEHKKLHRAGRVKGFLGSHFYVATFGRDA